MYVYISIDNILFRSTLVEKEANENYVLCTLHCDIQEWESWESCPAISTISLRMIYLSNFSSTVRELLKKLGYVSGFLQSVQCSEKKMAVNSSKEMTFTVSVHPSSTQNAFFSISSAVLRVGNTRLVLLNHLSCLIFSLWVTSWVWPTESSFTLVLLCWWCHERHTLLTLLQRS